MKLIAVTACPTGVAHTYMAAEALRAQAPVLGHEIHVETQGADGVGDELSPAQIDAADAVIIAADVSVDDARFAGKSIRRVSTADAIRHTERVIVEALPAVQPAAVTPASPGPTAQTATVEPDVAGTTRPRRLVGITSCPTGIAHTFMAAEGLQRGAESLGYSIKVETQGSVGAGNQLTAQDIADADAVIIAADTKVELDRFVGKPLYSTSTNDAIKHGPEVIERGLRTATIVGGDDGGGVPPVGAGAADRTGGGGHGNGDDDGEPNLARRSVREVYQHLMTGVSYMLPFVVAGGLMIAISFAFDINANDPANADTLAGRLFQIGGAALALFLPVFAGYVSFSIADRPGLVSGFVGGYLAVQVNAGFLGALVAGFIAGYLTRWLAQQVRLPKSMAGLKPVLILPLLSTFLVGLIVFYVIGGPIAWLQEQLTTWLAGLQGGNAVVLGLILGTMMATDMGGPLNKVAYTFGVGLIASGVTEPMAAVMAAGMTPPIGLALATVLFPSRWTTEEHEAGKAAFVLGLSFITEGAIPFAARDPLRVIPACIIGSATAGAISMGIGAATAVPHGGIFDLFVPGAVQQALGWLLAVVVGTLVTTAVLFVTKRRLEQPAEELAVAAV